MSSTVNRRIDIATIPNLRTLGGLPVSGGQVAHGLLFRSATLGELSAAGAAALAGFGVRHIVDFRTAGEREAAPDVLYPPLEGFVFDVLGDSAGDLAAGLGQIGGLGAESAERDPEAAAHAAAMVTEALGNGRGIAMLEASNRHLIETESARTAYRGFFTLLSRDDAQPTLFHCSTGKDRTGWAAAATLMLLGADDATVMDDYLQTNVDLLPMIEPMLARAAAVGIDPEILRPVLTVRESFLGTAIDTMREHYGSVDDYFVTGLGLTPGQIDSLRARLITSGAA